MAESGWEPRCPGLWNTEPLATASHTTSALNFGRRWPQHGPRWAFLSLILGLLLLGVNFDIRALRTFSFNPLLSLPLLSHLSDHIYTHNPPTYSFTWSECLNVYFIQLLIQ